MRHPHTTDYWGRGAYIASVPLEERKAIAEQKMAIVDSLPLKWRLLVHEYGWTRIKIARRKGLSPEQAEAEIIFRDKLRFRRAELAAIADELILE